VPNMDQLEEPTSTAQSSPTFGKRVRWLSTNCTGMMVRRRGQQFVGLLGRVFLSLNRVGWTRNGPTEWVDDAGVVRDLTQYAPRLFMQVMQDSTQRMLERKLASSNGHESFVGRRACIDFVRRFLMSKTRSRVEAIVVAAAATNAIWTLVRLFEAGYIVLDLKMSNVQEVFRHTSPQTLDLYPPGGSRTSEESG